MADISSALSQPRSIALQIPPASSRTPGQSGRPGLDPFSPVTEYGSFEFDRIIKAGEVSKRTRKTKSWKPIYIVLRPNLLSIYRDQHEAKLRHQINLSELTAIARQKDPKHKEKHIFGLFSPSRNYHLEAPSHQEAQEWVELIRREAKIDEVEEELSLASPGGGAHIPYRGFGRSIDANISPHFADYDRSNGGYSSSDAEAFNHSTSFPRQRSWGTSQLSSSAQPRRTSHATLLEYSGPEYGSQSDFSDSAPAARLSTLSLAYTDGRPSTSSNHPPSQPLPNTIYGPPPTSRPTLPARTASQISNLGDLAENHPVPLPPTPAPDPERVLNHSYIHHLTRPTPTRAGVRRWRKVWMVLRPAALALYKDSSEYTALLILPVRSIVDVVEIDPISRSKTCCYQIITEERKNLKFCATDEEALARWLGAYKSLLAARRRGLGSSGAG